MSQPKTIILLYHRVVEPFLDPQLLCVTPQHFAKHLEYLRKHCHPISLQDLKDAIDAKCIPDRAVVVTFDDGYVDNLYQAKPLLEQYDIPATVFIVTGKVGDNCEFWWDELERLLLLPKRLPEELSLTINGLDYSWQLEDSENSGRFDPECYQQWNVLMVEDPTLRHRVYRELCNLLRPMEDSAKQQILTKLCAWAGIERDGRSEYRVLISDEVRSLANGGLIEVGAHTVTHPMLAALLPEIQQREIENSKQHLEAILRRSVVSFSYPYGGRESYSMDTVRMVKEGGFACACSNFEGQVDRETDVFQLPRFLIRDWNIETFADKLESFFNT